MHAEARANTTGLHESGEIELRLNVVVALGIQGLAALRMPIQQVRSWIRNVDRHTASFMGKG